MTDIREILSLKPEDVKKPSYTMGERIYNRMALAYTYVIGYVFIDKTLNNEDTENTKKVLDWLKEDREAFFYTSTRRRLWDSVCSNYGSPQSARSNRSAQKAIDLAMKNAYCDMFEVVSSYFNRCPNVQYFDDEKLWETLKDFFELEQLRDEKSRLGTEVETLKTINGPVNSETENQAKKPESKGFFSWFKKFFKKG